MNHDDFSGSYYYTRNNFLPGSVDCISERGFVPLFGQMLVREESDCIPPLMGAGVCRNCTAGVGSCTNGSACDDQFDCVNGLCSNIDAGCPVEIASNLPGVIPGQDILFSSGGITVTASAFGPIWSAVTGWCGTSGQRSNSCSASKGRRAIASRSPSGGRQAMRFSGPPWRSSHRVDPLCLM